MIEKSVTAYKDLQFGPLGEGTPVEGALLWGDPATGPAAFLIRFPKGYAEPWHSHTSTYRAVLIEGQFQSRGKMRRQTSRTATDPGCTSCSRAVNCTPKSMRATGSC